MSDEEAIAPLQSEAGRPVAQPSRQWRMLGLAAVAFSMLILGLCGLGGSKLRAFHPPAVVGLDTKIQVKDVECGSNGGPGGEVGCCSKECCTAAAQSHAALPACKGEACSGSKWEPVVQKLVTSSVQCAPKALSPQSYGGDNRGVNIGGDNKGTVIMSAAQKRRERHLFCNDRNRIEQREGTYCGPWKKHGWFAGRQMATQDFLTNGPMMPGHLWLTNGDVYVGGWKDGEKSGQGKYYNSNGYSEEGEWAHDKYLG